MPALAATLASFDSPLYPSSSDFAENAEFKDLGVSTIKLLKDMKFLTTSLLATRAVLATPETVAKFEAIALRTYQQVSSLPSIVPTPLSSTEDLLYETIRLTAILYCKAVTSRTLLSKNCEPAICASLSQTMWLVSLSRWKTMPGIFLWVLLVACTSTEHMAQRLFLKISMWTVLLYIGLSSHEVAVACMRTFLKVQRWIKSNWEFKG